MRIERQFRAWLAVAAGIAAAGDARGFVHSTDDSGIYIVKWEKTQVPLRVMVGPSGTLSDGGSRTTAVTGAIETWNEHLGTVTLVSQPLFTYFYGEGNGISEITIDRTIYGEAFSEGTLAVTIGYRAANEEVESDIVFNGAYNWDSYRGDLRDAAPDLRRVALHEIGHLLGLEHPDEAGQTVNAIMNHLASDVDELQADDIAGGQALYGAKNFVPANNTFSAAAAIVTGEGAVRIDGANVAATREAGEPNHAGEVGGRSVWWKWTAPSDGTFGLSTFGSNFDTVIAVYTGASVDALTAVAANDDVDPGEIRTSAVSFAASAGATYHIAVGGWGDPARTFEGYSGSIVLNASFTTQTSAPLIAVQPASRNASRGEDVSLTVWTRAGALVQWQRNGVNVPQATSTGLTLRDLQPDDVGVYRAVVTAAGETAFSTPAIVGLTSGEKVLGAAREFLGDIQHANGNTYDQILLEGPAASIRADPGQIVRMSYLDVNDDIVQVEFSGAGTLTLTLAGALPPAEAASYNQPGIDYMQGHGAIVITGADETTHLSVFSVGKITAVNPALFRSDVVYDGMANLSYVAIASSQGRFGGLRTSNTSYFDTAGIVGLYAPGVTFDGPVYLGDVNAFSGARPTIVVGGAAEVWITGGSLEQDDDVAVEVNGFNRLVMKPGTDSHGNAQAAKPLAARLERDGVDVTDVLAPGN